MTAIRLASPPKHERWPGARMRQFSTSPGEMARSLWRNRDLILQLTRREVIGRYRGSMFGLVWSFFNPLLMLGVYTLVFGVVFNARWRTDHSSQGEFALILFAGLLVFNVFSECISRAPGLVLANPNYVKKVVFPLEVLPWVTVGSALFHAAVSFIVWLGFYILVFGAPHATMLMFPLVLANLVLIVLGLSWILASLGVYVRDIGQLVAVMIPALLFLSPIFYPLSALPEAWRILVYLNPMTLIVEQARDVMIWGEIATWKSLAVATAMAVTTAWLGFAWFQRTRRGFADVI